MADAEGSGKITLSTSGCDGTRLKREKYLMKLRVVLEPSEEGGYTAYVPSLPGCISEGESIQEALVNIQEAVGLYLEPIEEDERSIGE